NVASAVLKGDHDRAVLMLDVDVDFIRAEPDRAVPFAHQRLVQLSRYFPFALAEHMIDRSRDRGDGMRDLALRRRALKTARVFLGDESRAQLTGAPGWMLHDRGKKRDIVADTLDGEGVKRLRLCVDRLKPRCRVGDELGDRRIVIERNLAALGYPGIVAHRD